MFSTLKDRFTAWALRRQRFHEGTLILTQRSIYILPTKQGLGLAVVLVLMLLGDINYSLSLGYVLTFLLATMALMSMLHAFRNLARLEIRAGRAEAAFCGETARLMLHFRNPGPLMRYRLCLRDAAGNETGFDLSAEQDCDVPFPVPATRRGWLRPGRLTLYTEFPLGLFHAWSYVNFDLRCLVYPKPLDEAALPQGDAPDGAGTRSIAGDEDFAGLRGYVEGDALPHIAWKAYARERGLQVKQFSIQVGDRLWLDFDAAPDADVETRLARMARWVLDAEARGLHYGLRLPDGELPPGTGPAHRDACLRRLALFGLEGSPLPRPLSHKWARGENEASLPFTGQAATSQLAGVDVRLAAPSEGLGRGQ